jgi:hypothetical protein
MKFALTILIAMTSGLISEAQDWQTASQTDTTYFSGGINEYRGGQWENGYLRIIYADSTTVTGDISVLHFYKTLRDSSEQSCIDTLGASWLGHILERNNSNGFEHYFNGFGDTILIKTLAGTGESWEICNGQSGGTYIATITGLESQLVDGALDSIKTITVQAMQNGSPVADNYNGPVFRLSKDHGWLTVPDIFRFPNDVYAWDRFGAITSDAIFHRLSQAATAMDLNDISLRFVPGNEWIKVDSTDYPGGLSVPHDFYTYTYDSVIAVSSISVSQIQVQMRTRSYSVSHSGVVADIITSQNYDDTFLVDLQGPITLAARILPELKREIFSQAAGGAYGNGNFLRYFADTICDQTHTVIKTRTLMPYRMGLNAAPACIQFTPMFEFNEVYDSDHLDQFGKIYEKWVHGSEAFDYHSIQIL